MALQYDNREAGLAARAAFAVGFEHFRLKMMIVLHMQVGTNRTFLLIEFDRPVDELEEDNLEVYHTRLEQHRGLSALPG